MANLYQIGYLYINWLYQSRQEESRGMTLSRMSNLSLLSPDTTGAITNTVSRSTFNELTLKVNNPAHPLHIQSPEHAHACPYGTTNFSPLKKDEALCLQLATFVMHLKSIQLAWFTKQRM